MFYTLISTNADIGHIPNFLWFDWNQQVKFGGGFYCGKIEIEGKEPIYAFNGFFMAMRAKFVTPGTSIHYYVVEFDPSELSWKGD